MGIYMSEPIKDKHTECGFNKKFDFAASSM